VTAPAGEGASQAGEVTTGMSLLQRVERAQRAANAAGRDAATGVDGQPDGAAPSGPSEIALRKPPAPRVPRSATREALLAEIRARVQDEVVGDFKALVGVAEPDQIRSKIAGMVDRILLDGAFSVTRDERLALVDEIVSADCVVHSSLRGDQRGGEPVRQSYERYRAAFSDMHFTVIQRVAEGDKVSQNWSFTGIHKGEWNGVAATGKRVTYDGANVFRIDDGKLVEIWSYADMNAFLRQVGKTIS